MLTGMTTEERERLAHAEGFTEAAALLAELSDAKADRDLYADALETMLDQKLTAAQCKALARRVLP